MKSQDSQREKLEVTKAVMHALHRPDFVVDAFEFPIGDRIDPTVEDGTSKTTQCFGHRRGQFFPVDILEEELRFLIGVLGSSSGILSGEVES
jgi:hypothetical protein